MADIGAKIGIEGAQQFKNELQTTTQRIITLQSSMAALASEFKAGNISQSEYKKESKKLQSELDGQRGKLKDLQGELNGLAGKYGENDTQVNKWQQQINRATQTANSATEANENLGKATKDAGDKAKEAGINFDGLKTACAAAAAATAAAVTAAATAVGNLVKNSITAFSSQEQLVGGVETLFGAGGKTIEEYAASVGKTVSEVQGEYNTLMDSQGDVFDNAANAYKTAGMSASEYMETVTGFSASLIQSLDGDTAAAANLADVAITDMADNANKMGTSLDSIQTAYAGFAKGNYTMLDNLKLGYGGTKEEMQRLLDKAQEISGIEYDISSYADIVQAIHVVQDDLGIAGATANEAATTIEGSTNAMKSAWGNLVAGLADENADMGLLIDNFVESVGIAADNIIPRIKFALDGVGKLVEKLIPPLVDKALGFISDNLPQIISLGMDIVKKLGAAIITAIPALSEAASSIISEISTSLANPDNVAAFVEGATSLLLTLGSAIIDNLPLLIDATLQIVSSLVSNLAENTEQLVDSAVLMVSTICNGLIENLPALLEAAIQIVTELTLALTKPENIMLLIESAVKLIVALAKGIIQAIPQVLSAAIQVVSNLLSAIGGEEHKVLEKGKELIDKVINGIKDKLSAVVEKGKEIISSVKEGIQQKIDDAKAWGKDLIDNFIQGLLAKWEALKQKVKDIAQSIKDFLGFSEPKVGPLSNFHTYAPDMMTMFTKGIADNENLVKRQLAKSFNFDSILGNIGTAGPAVQTTQSTNNQYSISLNINGAGISDPQALADIVIDKLSTQIKNARGVYA